MRQRSQPAVAEIRGVAFNMRLTVAEDTILRAAAAAKGLPPTTFVRALALQAAREVVLADSTEES